MLCLAGFGQKDKVSFKVMIPAFTSISVIYYLYRAHRSINNFYKEKQFQGGDRSRQELGWLKRILVWLGLTWLLWMPFTLADFIIYNYGLPITAYYPLYLICTGAVIWVGVTGFLHSQPPIPVPSVPDASSIVPAELRQRSAWLKKTMQTHRYYEDPELSLNTLAVKLAIHPHELSRIINVALKKNFNDFVNEYRVRDVIRKMQDKAYDRLTLLAVAYSSGFNSKTTFNRTFKQITGTSAAVYKDTIKKERPFYKLGPASPLAKVISLKKTIPFRYTFNYSIAMIRNYIKMARRSLKKSFGFTTINILGLSAGLATFLLIVLYVADEISYDQYNLNADRIYRVTDNVKLNGNEASYAGSEKLLTEVFADYPEIEKYTRIIPKETLFKTSRKFNFKKGNANIEEQHVAFSESSLFSVFTLPMMEGDPATSLTAPHSAVITESMAKKYFNDVHALGKTLTLNDTSIYKVTGVIKDIPARSHFNFDFLLSYSSIPEYQEAGWGYSGVHNYILLKAQANIKKLEAGMRTEFLKHLPPSFAQGGNYFNYELTPILKIHLYSHSRDELSTGGNIQYVYTFSLIAIFILLIACVNFMNLSTARSSGRAKEVGVRKVLGSARKSLIAQFLTESMLMTLIAGVIAIIIAWLAMPFFNDVAAKHLSFSFGSLLWLVPALLVTVIIVGSLAGFYPAFVLSAFRPIEVLKGKLSTGFKGSFLRGFLVVFQFSISVFLIIGTVVIYNQLNFIHNKSLGFDRNEVLTIKNVQVLGNQALVFRNELKRLQGVENATLSSYVPTGEDRNMTGLFPQLPIDIKQDVLSQFWPVDENYLSTMQIKLLSGRNFSREMSTDSTALIVNEAFVKQFGFKDPLNKPIYRNSIGIEKFHIIGVVKDFNYSSLREEIKPLALIYGDSRGTLSIKVRTANLPSLMNTVKDKWKAFSPNQEFNYSFMDQDFDATYRSEQRIAQLFLSFSTLAILIACLGLFGLAAYAAEQRNKEIGIRKVLGATVPGIVRMLSIDFVRLVLLAILIASPLAWLAMNTWLQNFAYRIDIQWWVVLLASGVALVIAFITVSFQSIKAAIANPVKSLRSE
ncbi:ABC transporter permease [Mucilaginibacter ginsenosidivorax]|nr:ABC transporter permease [Mucilaginibacter ginsenosidivorax]